MFVIINDWLWFTSKKGYITDGYYIYKPEIKGYPVRVKTGERCYDLSKQNMRISLQRGLVKIVSPDQVS